VPSTREALGFLSDEQWLQMLARSIESREVDGIRLPGFPSTELQARSVGATGMQALSGAYDFYIYFKQQARKLGAPLWRESRILDFGVGWGRIVRFFLKDAEPSGLYGVDTEAHMIEACRDTMVPGVYSQIDPRGSLPYADRFFDCIYAYSVFTHLPEALQALWLSEIARVTKPGGVFVATVEPPRFLDFCASIDPVNPGSIWFAKLATVIRRFPGARAELEQRGFTFLPTRSGEQDWREADYGDSIQSLEYVRTRWSEYFDVMDYLDDPGRFWQAVVTCRKRP
jgi:SAM-dependent methyltransferase